MKQELQQSGKSDGAKQTPSQSTPQLAPQPAFNPSQVTHPPQPDGEIAANPAVEALARFQHMQRALMGADLREALKQSPVFNPHTNPTPNQTLKTLS